MKACITGANGFIGKYLCERLAAEGWQLKVLVLPGESTSFLEGLGAEIQFGNLLDPDSLAGIADGCTVVFHLAARVVDHGSRRQFHQAIYSGTLHLLEAIAHPDRHFILVSSIAAFGLKNHLNFPDEHRTPRKTGIYYGDAKLDAEELVKAYQKKSGMPYTIIRPCNVTGPGSVWVRYPLQKLQEWSGLPLIDQGQYPACLLEVRSLTDGMYRAATLAIAKGQTYFFMDDWEVTWKRYFEDLGKLIGKKPGPSLPFSLAWKLSAGLEKVFSPFGIRLPVSRIGTALTGRNNLVDTSKARNELGWGSLISYQEALQDIASWYAQDRPENKF